MKKEIMYIFLMIGVLFIYGCSSGTPVDVELKKTNLDTGEIQKTSKTLKLFAGTTSKFYRFDKAHYEKRACKGSLNSSRSGIGLFLI